MQSRWLLALACALLTSNVSARLAPQFVRRVQQSSFAQGQSHSHALRAFRGAPMEAAATFSAPEPSADTPMTRINGFCKRPDDSPACTEAGCCCWSTFAANGNAAYPNPDVGTDGRRCLGAPEGKEYVKQPGFTSDDGQRSLLTKDNEAQWEGRALCCLLDANDPKKYSQMQPAEGVPAYHDEVTHGTEPPTTTGGPPMPTEEPSDPELEVAPGPAPAPMPAPGPAPALKSHFIKMEDYDFNSMADDDKAKIRAGLKKSIGDKFLKGQHTEQLDVHLSAGSLVVRVDLGPDASAMMDGALGKDPKALENHCHMMVGRIHPSEGQLLWGQDYETMQLEEAARAHLKAADQLNEAVDSMRTSEDALEEIKRGVESDPILQKKKAHVAKMKAAIRDWAAKRWHNLNKLAKGEKNDMVT
eukprot:gnl/TRDRNA2_/TRDRNA2_181060_c0_seq1.p1 gnl/TRDRNA2_/TRDRNA2_181060_c0~~gnl/TRDRNA2_/TRDRNA2_181060_c0_seq1.p1  ORF type:complete len:415 (+),score=78.83 gnl/TRDRNA2_/TRDRNA2_181060_c0_seq1:108-1352(+)